MKNALDKPIRTAKKVLAAEIADLKSAMLTGSNARNDKEVFSASLRVSQMHRRVAAKQHALINLVNCQYIVEQHNQDQNVT